MSNTSLDKLKKIFDRIESYDPALNVGLRSLKNIGVWLSVYALTEEKDQATVLQELAEKAGLEAENDIIEMKAFVDSLVKPDVLKTIIEDYEKTNGSFTLSVKDETHKKLLESKMVERNLQDFLLSHVLIDPSQTCDLIFLMNNTIKFNWASNTHIAAKYNQTKDNFKGENVDFLVADSKKHRIDYGLVEHNDRLYHVANLGTLQQDEQGTMQSSSAFLIEPVHAENAMYLQKDYFGIIETIKQNGFNAEKTYQLLQDQKNTVSSVKIDGKLGENNDFHFIVRFPNLAGPLKTTEERLGVYGHFAKKVIANIPADIVKYKGVRELIYDEKGGEIKNREEFGMMKTSFMPQQNRITMQYTVANPFMMVYEALNGVDYYPYMIANPHKDLTVSFKTEDTYPTQQVHNKSSNKAKEVASEMLNLFSIKPKPAQKEDNELKTEKRCGLGCSVI